MNIESLSLRQREHTPGDCLCFGCFLHNIVFFVFSCGLDIRLIPSKLVLKLAIFSSTWVGRWNIKCLYKLNWRKWFGLRFNDGSLEVSRDFPGNFEDGPFVDFCWQVAWVGVKENRRLRWVGEDRVTAEMGFNRSVELTRKFQFWWARAESPKHWYFFFRFFFTGPQRAGPVGPSASPQEARIEPEMPGRLTWYADHLS